MRARAAEVHRIVGPLRTETAGAAETDQGHDHLFEIPCLTMDEDRVPRPGPGEIIERGGKEPGVPAPKPSVQKDPPSPPDAGSESAE